MANPPALSVSKPTLASRLRYRSHAYVHNRGTTAQTTPAAVRKSTLRSEKLSTRNTTKARFVELLKQLGTDTARDVLEKVEICGSKFALITCGKHIASRQPMFRCDHRLCPHCAARRSKDKMKKYLPIAFDFVQKSPVKVTPCHLVLTLAYREGETAKEAKQRLYDAFVKLKRRGYWKEHFAGGIYGIENTLSKATATQKEGMWHCHLHALVFRKKFVKDLAAFRAEWLAVTGDSCNLRLDLVTDLRSGMMEVLKYITKPSDFDRYTPQHINELLALKGEKMFGVFGEFSKFARNYEPEGDQEVSERFDYSEGDCCPHCEDPLFNLILTAADTVAFYRRLESMPRDSIPLKE